MARPQTAERDRPQRAAAPPSQDALSYWESLADESDRPEVQEMIRREIREGKIRVAPVSGSDEYIRIIPTK